MKKFSEKEKDHKRKIVGEFGSIRATIDQIQSSQSKKKKDAGGASGDVAELVTQMTERNEEVKRELECPVCLDEMAPPRQVWMCFNGHSICGECMMESCPTCKTPVDRRNIALEKMATKLFL